MSKYDDAMRAEDAPAEAVPAANENKYDVAMRGEDSTAGAELRASLYSALRGNPDDAAKAGELGKQTGLPAPVVERNLQRVTWDSDLNKYDYLLRDFPATAQQMRRPDLSRVAIDDLPVLTRIEGALVGLAKRGHPIGAAGLLAVEGAKLASSPEAAPRLGRQLTTAIPQMGASAVGAAELGLAVAQQNVLGIFTNPVNQVRKELGYSAVDEKIPGREYLHGVRKSLEQMSVDWAGDQSGGGVVEQSVGSGLVSYAQNLPWMVVGLLTRNPELALMGMSSQTFGQSAAAGLDKGLTPNQALAYATADTLVEYWTEKIPVGQLFKSLGGKEPFLKMLGKQMVSENIGEQVAQFAQDFDAWVALHPEKTLGDFWRERPTAALQTLIATVVATGANVASLKGVDAVVGKIQERSERKARAEHTQAVVTDLAKSAQESKTLQRSPAVFEQMVKAAAQQAEADGTDPVTNVYLDAAQLAGFYQSQNIPLEEAFKDLPEVRSQVQEALATTGDVVIPIEQFASRVLSDPKNAPIIDLVRLREKDASIADVKVDEAKRRQEFTEENAKILAEANRDEGFRQSSEVVKTTMRDRLVKLGQSPHVAETNATLYSAMIGRLAVETGKTPEEAHAEYGPRVFADGLPESVSFTQGGTLGFVTGEDGNRAEVHLKVAPVNRVDKAAYEVTYNGELVGGYETVQEAVQQAQQITGGKGAFYQGPVDPFLRWTPEKTKDGKFKGAPEWVVTDADFNKLLRRVRKFVYEGDAGRMWYEFSAAEIMRITGNDIVEAEKFIQLLAIYSAHTSVFPNTMAAVRVYNQWKAGAKRNEIHAATGSQDEKARKVLFDGIPFEGRKTSSFYTNLLHDLVRQATPEDVAKLSLPKELADKMHNAVTADLWMFRAFGYENPAASDDVAGTGRYSFVENSARRIAAELNQKLQPGQPPWKPHQIQAAIWTSIKARFEVPSVKQATIAESVKKGYSGYEKNAKGVLQWKAPTKTDLKRLHDQVWLKHALKADAQSVIVSVADAKMSFGDVLLRMTQNVTWEAIPSRALGLQINDLPPAVRARFTADALALITDEDGNDLLAQKLGAALNWIHPGHGGYAGDINPNVISGLVPTKPAGEFSRAEVEAYARAIQYIFRQDAVPYFRADAQASFEREWAVYDSESVGQKTVRRFDTQAEAETYAKENSVKGRKYAVRGGDFARGVHFKFNNALSPETEQAFFDALRKFLGSEAGYTKIEADEVVVINYRDDETRLPFVDDKVFVDALDRLGGQHAEELGIADVIWFGSEGRYGPVHDWAADPDGKALRDQAGATGSPDLQAWVRSRHEAFGELLTRWSGDELAKRQAEVEQSGLLFQSEPVFHSVLIRTVETAKLAKASGEQWLGTLRNTPGVKTEELDWYDLAGWLKGQKSVTREALLDYLRANELQVTEAVLDNSLNPPEEFTIREGENGTTTILFRRFEVVGSSLANAFERMTLKLEKAANLAKAEGHDEITDDLFAASERMNSWYEAYEGLGMPKIGSTKFDRYQTPGGENYREILITLPNNARPTDYQDVARDLGIEITPKAGEEWADAFRRQPAEVRQKIADESAKRGAGTFHSSHFDQPNIIAHLRVNDRVDANGKRVLFVEEVQSDWHQKGRKAGYRQANVDKVALKAELKTVRATQESSESGSPEYEAAMVRESEIIAQLNLEQHGGAVPDAPFKTTWPMLAMKRAIRFAAENGYDSVAWTTGEMQAERYDLSKQVDSIEIKKSGDEGLYSVIAMKNGEVVLADHGRSSSELDELIGKDLADKARTQKAAKHAYTGLDLKVGGEGMRSFYDRELVNETNKFVKKFGGKVGETEIDTGEKTKVDRKDLERLVRSFIKGDLSTQEFNDEAGVPNLIDDNDDFGRAPEPKVVKAVVDDLLVRIRERQGGVKVHSLDLTPALREAAMAGLPLFQQNRGAYSPSERAIVLLKDANLSTFAHELAHWRLDVMVKLASQPNAPTQLVTDLKTLLDWFGVDSLDAWQSMTLDQQRPHHEKLAQGFEAYLFKGESPNAELASVFARLRSWMLQVYKSIKALGVHLTPEVTQVFDRMVASEESIAAAEETRGYRSIFDSLEEARAKGVSEEDWKSIQEKGAAATADAVSDLERRSLKDMQWLSNAKSRELRRLQGLHDTAREGIREEVEKEVRLQPVYRALHWLKTGEMVGPDGNLEAKVEAGNKFSRQALAELYPAENLNNPDLSGLRGMVADEGLSPDDVAPLFGFTSGDHLVRAILDAQPLETVVDGMTDQRMLEQHGELVDARSMERAAEAAIHNEARMRAVAAELGALEKANQAQVDTGKRTKRGARMTVNAVVQSAKAYAREAVARQKVRDVRRTSRYSTAEGKASRAAMAALKAGKLAEAAAAKRSQILSAALFRESEKAVAEVDKIVAYLKKFSSEGTRENIDRDYLDQIDQILESIDLRKVTLKETARRQNLAQWVESQREIGLEPTLDPDLLAAIAKTPYTELTVEQLRGTRDAIKNIEHFGRLKTKLLTAKDAREFAAIVDDLEKSIETNSRGRTAENRTGTTKLDRAARLFKGFLASHRKLSSLARQLDGSKDGGAMWERFVRGMNEAGDHETTMREEATIKLAALIQPLIATGKMGGRGIFIKEIGKSLNREQRLAVALNIGNSGNLQRLLSGEKWTQAQLDTVLDTLTAEDWQFVQSVWDLFESYKPLIAAKEIRVNGTEPDWIEPTPVQTKFGELRGGYYPVKYDRLATRQAEAHAEAEDAKALLRAAYTSTTTRRSFTKNRAEKVENRPILLTFGGIYQGLNEVIHDLSWHEWLIDSTRLLRAIDSTVRNTYGAEIVEQFRKSFEDIGRGDVPAQQDWERVLNHLRTGTTVAGLGWNLMTSLLQPIGLTQSMVRVGPKWVAQGIGKFVSAPRESLKVVYGKSEMMRLRAKTMQREINEIQNTISGDKSKGRALVEASFFVLIQKAQLGADVPTWLGAYDKAIAEGNDEPRSVALADQAVIDSQGGGQIKDLALVQRGGPALKLFTNFISYFNLTYNLAAESARRTNFKSPGSVLNLAVDYLLLLVLPSVLGSLLRAAVMGGGDDDELAKRLIGDQISYLLGLMVGVREMTSAVQYATGTNLFPTSYGGPAGVRFFTELEKLGKQVGQGEADMALFKAAVNVAGIALHWPAAQINRTAEGVAALYEGRTENPLVLATGPPR